MSTVSSSSKVAYMYDAASDTWYAVAGVANTNVPYSWTQTHTFGSVVTANDVIRAKAGVNRFQNPAARDAVITSPQEGTVCYVEQTNGGTDIKEIQCYVNGSWRGLTNTALFVEKVSNHTLNISDPGKTVLMNSGTSVNVTVPSNTDVQFAIGHTIKVVAMGAGTVNFVEGSGVTILSKNSSKTIAYRYGEAELKKTGTNTWLLTGDLITGGGLLSTFSVTYDCDGGSNCPANSSHASPYTIPSTIPVKSGYQFLGYEVSAAPGALCVFPSVVPNAQPGHTINCESNLTIKAVWTPLHTDPPSTTQATTQATTQGTTEGTTQGTTQGTTASTTTTSGGGQVVCGDCEAYTVEQPTCNGEDVYVGIYTGTRKLCSDGSYQICTQPTLTSWGACVATNVSSCGGSGGSGSPCIATTTTTAGPYNPPTEATTTTTSGYGAPTSATTTTTQNCTPVQTTNEVRVCNGTPTSVVMYVNPCTGAESWTCPETTTTTAAPYNPPAQVTTTTTAAPVATTTTTAAPTITTTQNCTPVATNNEVRTCNGVPTSVVIYVNPCTGAESWNCPPAATTTAAPAVTTTAAPYNPPVQATTTAAPTVTTTAASTVTTTAASGGGGCVSYADFACGWDWSGQYDCAGNCVGVNPQPTTTEASSGSGGTGSGGTGSGGSNTTEATQGTTAADPCSQCSSCEYCYAGACWSDGC